MPYLTLEDSAALTPVSCSNADTVGEFVRGVCSRGFAFPEGPILPKFRPNDPAGNSPTVSNATHTPKRAVPRPGRLRPGQAKKTPAARPSEWERVAGAGTEKKPKTKMLVYVKPLGLAEDTFC